MSANDPNLKGYTLATANEAVSAVKDMYVATGPREKLAYRKGFETGFDLAMEYWSKEFTKEYARHNAKVIIDILIEAQLNFKKGESNEESS